MRHAAGGPVSRPGLPTLRFRLYHAGPADLPAPYAHHRPRSILDPSRMGDPIGPTRGNDPPYSSVVERNSGDDALDLTDEFRTRAAECLRLAENAHSMADQTMWLDMAQFWLRLSEHARQQETAKSIDPARRSENGNGDNQSPQKPK